MAARTIQPAHPGPGFSTGHAAGHRIHKVAGFVQVDGTWLDLGCGPGEYGSELLRHGCRCVVGCDPRFEEAWVTSPLGHEYVQSVSEALPFVDQSFDGVLINEVLEHVADDHMTLSEVHRILKPSGVLVLFGPNRWFPLEGHGATLGPFNVEVPVPVLPWLPRGLASRWMRARNYWPGELSALVKGAGLVIEQVGFAYPLFNEYEWLPRPAANKARALAPRFETIPVVRRFGVSTMIIARRPDPASLHRSAGRRSDTRHLLSQRPRRRRRPAHQQ